MPTKSCIAHIAVEVLGLHLSQHSDWMGLLIPRHDLKVTHASVSVNVGTQWAPYTEALCGEGQACSNGPSPNRWLTLAWIWESTWNALRLAWYAGVLSDFYFFFLCSLMVALLTDVERICTTLSSVWNNVFLYFSARWISKMRALSIAQPVCHMLDFSRKNTFLQSPFFTHSASSYTRIY